MTDINAQFRALPLAALADAALSRAKALGVDYASLRVMSTRSQRLSLRNAVVESAATTDDLGLAVRVVHEGTWGFAAGFALTAEEAARLAERAVAVAKLSRAVSIERVELAPEPTYADVEWVSNYQIDPFQISDTDKAATLTDMSERLMAADGVEFVDASCYSARENTYYADTFGTTTLQQRIRVHPELTATNIDRATGKFETMRTICPPAARGWEFLTSDEAGLDVEIVEIPELLAQKVKAPSVVAGRYDLVIHPSNLFLTIHESIGHATELDRALGYEAAYAGTSFATLDKLNTLQYGSSIMNVTGDRSEEWGLASVGYDDEGVAAQKWDIIKDGLLVGYQTDRAMAAQNGFGRSNGCAFADSAAHVPVQRMANVTLQPSPDGGSTEDLISQVEEGIYVVGDKSWSIDMQRYNFQFTGQRFFSIKNGEIAGQIRDVAYQATTTDFWGSMDAVGGPETFYRGGAFNCGKAQPGQVAAVSHGCPSALFRSVRILNTVEEAGQ